MYFHLLCSAEILAVASGRKSTRKLFRQATKLMVVIDHEFVGNSTSPPFAFLTCPSRMRISLRLGEATCRGVLRHTWVQKTQVKIVRKR